MARTLLDLRTELLDRLNFASQAAADAATVRLANSFLRNAQAFLYWQYDFPELKRRFTIALNAGTVEYAFPTLAGPPVLELEPRRIVAVTISKAATTRRSPVLRQGIYPSMYDQDPTGEPTHYELRDKIELWPKPDVAGYTANIEGFIKLRAFTADGDTTTLDDELVFMMALANAKAHYRQADAEIYAKELQSLLARLKGFAHGGRRYIPGVNDEATAAPRPMPKQV